MEAGDWIGVYGAMLASVLAIFEIVKHFRDKPRIEIKANLLFTACTQDGPIKGLRIHSVEKGYQEVLLEISIANSGSRPLQVSSLVFPLESGSQLLRVNASGLPRIVEPNTSVDVIIQKGWIDKFKPAGLGVWDAFGRGIFMNNESCATLLNDCAELPPDVVRIPSESQPVFQAKDEGRIVSLRV